MARSLDDVTAYTGKSRKWSDGLKPYKFKEGWNKVRLYGLVYTDYRHTVKTTSSAYYEFCHGWDEANERWFADREDKCECCRMKVQGSIRYFMNVFDLDVWENQPRNPPPDWSPIFLAEFSPSLMTTILNFKPLNGGFSVAHEKNGAVIGVKYDKSAAPAQMYTSTLSEKNWMFTEEMAALTVVQELPDGRRVVNKGNGKIPGAFEYHRGVGDRANMVSGLTRYGYYGNTEGQSNGGTAHAASPEVHSKATAAMQQLQALDVDGPDDKPAPRVSNVKQLAQLHAQEDAPAPKASAPVRAAPPPQPVAEDIEETEIPFEKPLQRTVAAVGGQAGRAPQGCPTDYGQFARAQMCFTRCSVRKACESASGSSTMQKAVGADFDDDSL